MDHLVRAFMAAGGMIVVKTVKSKARKGTETRSRRKTTLVFEMATAK
jgi:hypothetical protein